MNAYIKNKRIPQGDVGHFIPIYFSPTAISESISSNYDQQNIPGRSSPVISYSSTGARQVNISLYVSPDRVPNGYSSVKQYIKAIKALEYPNYDENVVIPPNCYLSLPNLNLDGVCTNVNIEYRTDRFYMDNSLAAEINLSFLEVEDTIKGAVTVVSETGGMTSDEFYNKEAVSYDEFVSDISTKLALYGGGLGQSIGSRLYLDMSEDKYTDKNTGNYVGEEICKFTVSTSDVFKVKLEVICESCGKGSVIYTYDNIKYNFDSANGNVVAMRCYDHIDNYAHFGDYRYFTLRYTPIDSDGNVYSDFIRYRYIAIKTALYSSN